MAPDKVFPDAGDFPQAPPGSYFNKDLRAIPPPATYRERRRGRGGCCCCLLWLISTVTIFVVLVGLAVLIFWLVVQPKAPQFQVNDVRVDGITGVSPLNMNTTYQITARNPNKKMGFDYSSIFVKVEAYGEAIGNGTVADFYQGHKNSTSISGVIVSDGVTLSSGTLSALLNDSSNVPLYAQVDLKVKIKVAGVTTGKIKVKVKCDLTVDLTTQSSGSQLKSSKCKVDW